MEHTAKLRAVVHRIMMRRRNRSRIRRIFDRTATVLGCLWIFIILFPTPLFAHSAQAGRFKVHSDHPIPDEIQAVIAKAEACLNESPLLMVDQTFAIYMANDSWRARLLYPLGNAGFGRSNLIGRYVILNRCDVTRNVCFRGDNSPTHNERSLSSVIAHECTHQLIRNKLGLIGAVRLPTWKNEGYCEYVADAPTIAEEDGFRMLAEGKTSSAPAFDYFTYFVVVRHLLDQHDLTIDELFGAEINFNETLEAATDLGARGEP